MKCILRGYGINMTPQQRFVARSQAADMTIARGTAQKPLPPRDLFVQSGPRGVLLNWRPSAGLNTDIAGWRVYTPTEDSLYAELKDPNTNSHFIEVTAGTTPPTVNFFVSSINKLGNESAKVAILGSATSEAGAPTMPTKPPSYSTNYTKIGQNPRLFDPDQNA